MQIFSVNCCLISCLCIIKTDNVTNSWNINRRLMTISSDMSMKLFPHCLFLLSVVFEKELSAYKKTNKLSRQSPDSQECNSTISTLKKSVRSPHPGVNYTHIFYHTLCQFTISIKKSLKKLWKDDFIWTANSSNWTLSGCLHEVIKREGFLKRISFNFNLPLM